MKIVVGAYSTWNHSHWHDDHGGRNWIIKKKKKSGFLSNDGIAMVLRNWKHGEITPIVWISCEAHLNLSHSGAHSNDENMVAQSNCGIKVGDGAMLIPLMHAYVKLKTIHVYYIYPGNGWLILFWNSIPLFGNLESSIYTGIWIIGTVELVLINITRGCWSYIVYIIHC